ncbi:hypothetical protein DFJ74DRAFT_614379 [Hyaloraphidium curvatum]|nr:hypothetical protein DFJ74DRAFT_614379 [Hyaloraphidium curvatum]
MWLISTLVSIAFGAVFVLGLGSLIPPFSEPPRSAEVGPAKAGEGRTRRHAKHADKLLTNPEDGVATLYDVLVYAARTFKTRDALGQRPVKRVIEEEKEIIKDGKKEVKKWSYFELGPYEWWSAREFANIARSIGSGLRGLGYGAGDILCIYAGTSRDWQAVAHGCFSQSITIATSYETLGEDALAYGLNEGPVKVIFAAAEQLPVVAKVAAKVPSLKHVVYNGTPEGKSLEEAKKTAPQLVFVSLEDLKKAGTDKVVEPVPPKPEDVACIMYTSGSTGDPKGVIIPHSMVVAGISGAVAIVDGVCKYDGTDTFIAYLPLAHILEFTVEQTCIFRGIRLGYGSPKTLLDSSVRNCLGDIKELKPTLMAGVPAVWDGVRKSIQQQLGKLPPWAQGLVDRLIALKWWMMERRLPTHILDAILFNRIKANLGGRLVAALSGGAPISRDTQQFLSTLICPIIQGYGLTESCGVVAVQSPPRVIVGAIGEPVPACEVKLVDVPDAGYYSSNKPNPQGEIWARGKAIMRGYYKKPELTKEALTEDGWLMTGDIGEWGPDGCLRIIDRKKNLIKLSHGEYIAIERLESLYTQDPVVQTLVLYADPEQDSAVALLLPREPVLREICAAAGIPAGSSVSFEALCKDPKATALILKQLLATGKKAGMKKAELISGVTLIPDEWTPQNGMLTAAMKLNRKPIVKKYDKEIKAMYKK